MAHVVRGRSSKGGNYAIVLRNPAEKAERYAKQLKTGKVSETHKKLSATDRAFRVGYLTARSDSAKAFNANKGKRIKRNNVRKKR